MLRPPYVKYINQKQENIETLSLKTLKFKYTTSKGRDSYGYKRIEIAGTLISQLFKEYYTKQLKAINLYIDSKFFYESVNGETYHGMDFKNLILKKVTILIFIWGIIALVIQPSSFPRSVILINFFITLTNIVNIRLLAKLLIDFLRFFLLKVNIFE